MNSKSLGLAALALAAGIGIGYAVTRVNTTDDGSMPAVKAEKKVLYWKAPMNPNFRSDKPGKGPMGMDLVPVYADEGGGDDKAVRISPAVINNIGVRTQPVVRSTLNRVIDTIGFIMPDDDATSHVHVRVSGWIEKLYFKTEGERVKKGDLLFQMYSPELVNAQVEYLQALTLTQKALAAAARERLIALGMTDRQITRLRKRGQADQLVDIRAPQDGVIIKLNVGEGMFIKPDTTVVSLTDLSTIWAMVEVYEDQSEWVAEGQKAVMRLPYLPGRVWEGVIDYVYPTIDPKSRTLQVRLKFDNPGEELKPNMYAETTVYGTPKEAVLNIPVEALIRSGKSERVVLALGQGRFRPARVVSGMEAGDRVEITSGLREGETVVTSSQFLIDSEASLNASFLRMEPQPEMSDMKDMKDMPAKQDGEMK